MATYSISCNERSVSVCIRLQMTIFIFTFDRCELDGLIYTEKGVTGLLQGKFDPRDMNLYFGVQLTGIRHKQYRQLAFVNMAPHQFTALY